MVQDELAQGLAPFVFLGQLQTLAADEQIYNLNKHLLQYYESTNSITLFYVKANSIKKQRPSMDLNM